MKITTSSDLYYSIRRNLYGGDLWYHSYSDEFVKLLKEYNAVISTDGRDPAKDYACDHLGICPGVDMIEFHDEKLYAIFLLRWS